MRNTSDEAPHAAEFAASLSNLDGRNGQSAEHCEEQATTAEPLFPRNRVLPIVIPVRIMKPTNKPGLQSERSRRNEFKPRMDSRPHTEKAKGIA